MQLAVVVQAAGGEIAAVLLGHLQRAGLVGEHDAAFATDVLEAFVADRFVDEIAQVQDEIRLLFQQRHQAVVPAPAVVLATDEAELQCRRRRIRGRRGARAPGRRSHPGLAVAAQEPIEIALPRPQVLHAHAQAMVGLGARQQFALHAQLPELRIVRDLQAQGDIRADWHPAPGSTATPGPGVDRRKPATAGNASWKPRTRRILPRPATMTGGSRTARRRRRRPAP